MDAGTVSLTGINAAATKLAVSANNIANSSSTKKIENGVEKNEVFVPSKVQDVSLGDTGGVKSIVSPLDPATFLKTYDPLSPDAATDGTVTKPNVDFAQETVSQIEAKNAYQANLLTLEAKNKTTDQLLDIIS